MEVALVAIVIFAIGAMTLWTVWRDGYGPRATQRDHDSRRPTL